MIFIILLFSLCSKFTFQLCCAMYVYDTASQAISDLVKRGYNTDFNIDTAQDTIVGDHLVTGKRVSLSPDEFEIDEVYRFEGNTDPGDEMVVYAISSKKHDVKGTLVNAFGPYSDSHASAMIRKLTVVSGQYLEATTNKKR